ncbi:MAG: hypothetical protein GC193_07570 [Cryomorphaceae bacterium]|nr:hypothetical protein [Cryomorphaceae bacterium]
MKFSITALFFVFAATCLAQDQKATVFGFPLFYYTPETGYGGGLVGAYSFYLNSNDSISPPSLLQAGFSYTENKQFTFYAPVQFFWDKRNWMAGVEVGIYDYSLLYFGENESQAANGVSYDAEQVKLRGNIQRRIYKAWYAGFRLWYDRASIFFQNTDNREPTIGNSYYSPGLLISHDRRDNVFYPSCGNLVELVTQQNFGSSSFMRYRVDLRFYTPLTSKVIWANQFFVDAVGNDAPFYLMPQLGGSKRFRGFYEGKLRADNAVMFQTELRGQIYRRWGAALFTGLGNAEATFAEFKAPMKITYGGGVRFMADRKKKLNLRLDVGAGDHKPLFYLSIGEAF